MRAWTVFCSPGEGMLNNTGSFEIGKREISRNGGGTRVNVPNPARLRFINRIIAPMRLLARRHPAEHRQLTKAIPAIEERLAAVNRSSRR